jgi:hypothetical protein
VTVMSKSRPAGPPFFVFPVAQLAALVVIYGPTNLLSAYCWFGLNWMEFSGRRVERWWITWLGENSAKGEVEIFGLQLWLS